MKKQIKKPFLVAVRFYNRAIPNQLYSFSTEKAQELFINDLEKPKYKSLCSWSKSIAIDL